jgi:hypothetical protein
MASRAWYVQTRPRNGSCGKGASQRGLVDDIAACGVDQHRTRTHARQPRRVDQVARGRRRRAMQGDGIACRQELVQRLAPDRVEPGERRFIDRAGLVKSDAHVEAVTCPGGHGATDPPHADDAQRRARHPGSQHVGWPPTAPGAGANVALALPDPPHYCEQQRHRQVRGVVGEHAGGVRHDDSVCRRGGEIDVVVSDPEIRNDPGPAGFGPEDRGVDPVSHRDEHAVRRTQRVDEGLLRERSVVGAEASVEELGDARLDGRRKLPGHDHARTFHICSVA